MIDEGGSVLLDDSGTLEGKFKNAPASPCLLLCFSLMFISSA